MTSLVTSELTPRAPPRHVPRSLGPHRSLPQDLVTNRDLPRPRQTQAIPRRRVRVSAQIRPAPARNSKPPIPIASAWLSLTCIPRICLPASQSSRNLFRRPKSRFRPQIPFHIQEQETLLLHPSRSLFRTLTATSSSICPSTRPLDIQIPE